VIWQEHHHLYIGIVFGIICLAPLPVGMALHNWWWIGGSIIGVLLGFGYALDDVFQHALGWNTLFHRIDVWLMKWRFWQRISSWLDKYIFKSTEKQIEKLKALNNCFGMLKELSLEDLKEFESAVKRKKEK
jgi:hypothetical protein